MKKNSQSSRPELPRPPRLPHTTYVAGKPGPRKWRARLQVNGERPEAWGVDATEAIERWISDWRQSLIRPRPSSASAASDEQLDDVEPRPETMAAFIDSFVANYAAMHRAPGTAIRYRRTGEELKTVFGNRPFSVSRASIQAHLNRLIVANEYTTAIAKHARFLSKAYNWALTDHFEWLGENPARRLNYPSPKAGVRASQAHEGDPPTKEWPSRDEVQRLLEATKDDDLGPLWYAIAVFGLRPGEGVALHRDYLTPGPSGRAEHVLIHRKLARHNRVVGVGPTKNAQKRTLSLPPGDPRIAALLDQAESMAELETANPTWDPRWAGFLFRRAERSGRAKAGSPVAPDTLKGAFDEALRKAGIDKPYTPHSLRHYHISEMFRAGFSLKEVAAWTGHDSLRVLEETYAHVLREVERPERHSDALDAMNLPRPSGRALRRGNVGVRQVGSNTPDR